LTIITSEVGTNTEIYNDGLPGEDEILSFCLDIGRITGCSVDVACPWLSD